MADTEKKTTYEEMGIVVDKDGVPTISLALEQIDEVFYLVNQVTGEKTQIKAPYLEESIG